MGGCGWLPKLTHILGFTCKSEGYRSLSNGDEREIEVLGGKPL